MVANNFPANSCQKWSRKFLVALLMFRNWPQHILELGVILIGATWLAIVGFLDDRLELRPWAKFPAQIMAALLVVISGVRNMIFAVSGLNSPDQRPARLMIPRYARLPLSSSRKRSTFCQSEFGSSMTKNASFGGKLPLPAPAGLMPKK